MFKQKDKRSLNKSIDMLRITSIAVLFGVVVLLFFVRLFQLQIIKKDYYSSIAIPKTYRSQRIEVSRGQIFDINGKLLVQNKKQYNITINKATLDNNDYNTTLLEFIRFCMRHNIQLTDNLPVSAVYPYELDNEYIFDADKEKKLKKLISNNQYDENDVFASETSLYDLLCKKYRIPEENRDDSVYRKLVGLRYDMETNDFEFLHTYTVLSDIDETTRVLFAESLHTMHGIEITETDMRHYSYDSLACHVLGTTGKISPDETEAYVTNKGYDYDSIIGKDGAEKAFEDYLHGFDGYKQIELDENNNVVGEEIIKQTENGYSVKLTIDADMQTAAEKALEEQILYARSLGGADIIPNNGEDCSAGSVVVMDVNSGQVRVSASYPNYNLNTFSKDFNELLANDAKPLLNRATQGMYPPGSTFKIAAAIAGLCSGVINENTLIYDAGVYVKYPDYEPHCWIYDNTGGTHGFMDVKGAIENSCNYFFYELGDKMGIDTLTEYASKLGLGAKTGIEVPEYTGILAGPEYRDRMGLLWNPGDTLQASIGQSDNAFTPLQLCSYMSAVVNGGVRYKATLLDSVVDYYSGEVIYDNMPTVLDKIDIPQKHIDVLKSAMKSVVVDGTARTVFDDYEYEVGGKTGTAQMGKGSDTALFVGFAPYDKPEIVVAVVVENGDKSSRATEVAKAVFDQYFGSLEGDLPTNDEGAAIN